MSDMLRITGLVSGMDTDATVKKLIEIEQLKVDKAKQEKQYLEWQKEDYRNVANLMRTFQDEYFDILNSDTYMLSQSTYNMFSGSASIGGVESSAVSIRTSASSITGSFTINEVKQLATKNRLESGSQIFGNITSGNMTDFSGSVSSYSTNKELLFTLDGVTKSITLDDNLDTNLKVANNLSLKLQEAFGNVQIDVNLSGTGAVGDEYQIEFDILKQDGSGIEEGHVLTVENTNSDLLTDLGLEAGQTNTLQVDKTLEEMFDISTEQSMTINGTTFTFSKDTTIKDMMDEINNESGLDATISFDSFSDKFTIESNTEGTEHDVSLSGDTDLLVGMKLDDGNIDNIASQGSVFIVNGVETTRTDNTFEINGSTITLEELSTEAITVNVVADTDDAKDLIVGFVDKYNEMIEEINSMLGESKNYDYKPLTDAQKEEMSEDEIERWEEQARKGGLRNDSTLENIMVQMRQALYESVEDVGISLADIGIQTSANYLDAGKLVVDEEKLDTALKENPNEIIELFTKQSDVTYASYTDRSQRYNENGLASRLDDIIKDNIRITRDPGGNKGYLIEKAGLNSGTDTTSELAKKIQEMDEKIDDLLELLGDKENSYYEEFARMESAMSSYSSQSAWLTSQFGG